MQVYDMPMHKLAAMLKTGELTSADLTSKVLERIKSVEKDVAAYLVIDEEGAMRQAEKADALLKSGAECSMLTGIPMALKDNMCTTDMTTTCASRILEGFVAPYEATVAQKLRAAGSVILGKANMMNSQWDHPQKILPFKKRRILGISKRSQVVHLVAQRLQLRQGKQFLPLVPTPVAQSGNRQHFVAL